MTYNTPWSTVGFLTYARTYSRKKADGSQENFEETIERCLGACDSQLGVGFTPAEREEFKGLLMNLKCSFAGRFLWQLGARTVDDLGLPSLQNCAFVCVDSPVRPFTWAFEALMLGCGVGFSVEGKHLHKLPKVSKNFTAPTRLDNSSADFIVPDTREGWVRLLGKMLKCAFVAKTKHTFSYSTQLIRGRGAPIKGFGGTASGPEILVEGIQKIAALLESRRGKKLRSIDALDIMNTIGHVVVAGNIRRCLAGGTLVETRAGQVSIEDMSPGDLVKTTTGWKKVLTKFDQGLQRVIRLTTDEGEVLCTSNHRMAKLRGGNNYTWTHVHDLRVNDLLCRAPEGHDLRPSRILSIEPAGLRHTWDIEVEDDHEFFANGYLSHNSAQIALGDSSDSYFLAAKDWSLGDLPSTRAMSNNTVVCSDIKDLPESFWTAYKGDAGECIGLVNLEASRKYGRYGDERYPDPDVMGVNPCCVTGETTILTRKGSVPIESLVNTPTETWNGEEWSLVTPQLKGTKAKLVHVQLEDGRELTCTPEHAFIIQKGSVQVRVPAGKLQQGDQLAHFDMPVLDRGYEVPQPAPTAVQLVTKLADVADVYCFTESSQGRGTFNGIVTGQSEQTLNNFETCALGTINLPLITSKAELFTCLKYVYRAVKHSLSLPCSLKETEAIVHKNMRMGLNPNGYLQATDEQRQWLAEVYEDLRAYDKEYSVLKGFPESIKLTTTQPGGTLSLLPGITPGSHPGYAQYMIRRIQIAADSPLIKLVKAHGYHVEYRKNFDRSNDLTTMVAEFPYAYPEGTTLAKDITAVQQLDVVRRLQREWSDNAISCTVYYKKEELPEIRTYLENHWHEMKAVSFLLHSDHGFAQAPYEEITKEQYDELVAKTRLITSLDPGTLADGPDYDGECAGGSCPIR